MYQFSIVRNFACDQTPGCKLRLSALSNPGDDRHRPNPPVPHVVKSMAWVPADSAAAARPAVSIAAPLPCRVQSGVNENDRGCPRYGPHSESRISSKLVRAAGLLTGRRVDESAAQMVAESAAAGAFTRSRRVVVSVGGRWWRRRRKSDGPIPVVLARPVPVLSIGPCGDAAEDTQHQEQESHQPVLPSSIHPRRPCRGSADGRVIATSVPLR